MGKHLQFKQSRALRLLGRAPPRVGSFRVSLPFGASVVACKGAALLIYWASDLQCAGIRCAYPLRTRLLCCSLTNAPPSMNSWLLAPSTPPCRRATPSLSSLVRLFPLFTPPSYSFFRALTLFLACSPTSLSSFSHPASSLIRCLPPLRLRSTLKQTRSMPP